MSSRPYDEPISGLSLRLPLWVSFAAASLWFVAGPASLIKDDGQEGVDS